MGYTRLNRLVGEKAGAYLECIAEDDSLRIARDVARCLSDEHFLGQSMTDGTMIGLYNITSALYEQVQTLILREIDICKLVLKTKVRRYKIEAMNGLRFATVNEVQNGVTGLITEFCYPAGEDVSKEFFILAWAVSGNPWYYRQAGFKNNFSECGTVTDTVVDMLSASASVVADLIKFMKDAAKLDKTLKVLKKSSKFEYTPYAVDEVTEEISVKQLLLDCESLFSGKSNDKGYNKAKSIMIRSKRYPLEPYEISELRKLKTERLNAGDSIELKTINEELKKKCEYLLSLRYTGQIKRDAFVFKVIKTLELKNYSWYSDKQLNIVEDALKTTKYYEKEKETEDQSENIISDDDIERALGEFDTDADVDESMLSIGELPW